MRSAKRQFDLKAFLAKVGTGRTILKYRKGRVIYSQGEEADRIFYIQSGKVKVTVVSQQGKEAVVGVLDPAQFFGEGCLNGQAVRVGTARAMEESLITSITRKAMMAALRKEPRFSEHCLSSRGSKGFPHVRQVRQTRQKNRALRDYARVNWGSGHGRTAYGASSRVASAESSASSRAKAIIGRLSWRCWALSIRP